MNPNTSRYNGDEFFLFFGIATVIFQFISIKWKPNLSIEEPIYHLYFDSSKDFWNMFATIIDK